MVDVNDIVVVIFVDVCVCGNVVVIEMIKCFDGFMLSLEIMCFSVEEIEVVMSVCEFEILEVLVMVVEWIINFYYC